MLCLGLFSIILGHVGPVYMASVRRQQGNGRAATVGRLFLVIPMVMEDGGTRH